MGVIHKLRPVADVRPLALDRIIRDDCIAAMASLPDACVDMVFADPPV